MSYKYLKPKKFVIAAMRDVPEDASECEDSFDEGSDGDMNLKSECSSIDSDDCDDFPAKDQSRKRHLEAESSSSQSAKRQRNASADVEFVECVDDDSDRLIAADGTEWRHIITSIGTAEKQNVLKYNPGPTDRARNRIISGSPLSAWRLLIDNSIMEHIRKYTIAEAHRQDNKKEFTLSAEELEAFIGIIYTRGISGRNELPITDLWSEYWGHPLCKKSMAKNRFCEIMRHLRFDDRSTRGMRLKIDKFALFSSVWEKFIDNSIECYKPGANITIDELLFQSKVKCPFTQISVSKSKKIGQRYWLAVDSNSKYVVNGFPSIAKEERQSEYISDNVVSKLVRPYLNKGRNIIVNKNLSSLSLAKSLRNNGTKILGTINTKTISIPHEIKTIKQELYSTKVFRNSDNMTITIFQRKRKESIAILSSIHSFVGISDDAKNIPETVQLYNETKYGVDIVDQMTRKYNVKSNSRRWPIQCFQNTLNLAAINALILYNEVTLEKMPRGLFLKKLAEELVSHNMKSRDTEKPLLDIDPGEDQTLKKRLHCQIKTNCNKNKSMDRCAYCKKSVCGRCVQRTLRYCKICVPPPIKTSPKASTSGNESPQ